ncbi:hypothetical protein [Schaalia suimastitidis]|uniref:hypothetical protein n=1 Tax=Schaalia suimastitidis TaxID=121163 RepID=UPI0003FE3198|nr:hypothetical protein [Schaalia suimastitidis]
MGEGIEIIEGDLRLFAQRLSELKAGLLGCVPTMELTPVRGAVSGGACEAAYDRALGEVIDRLETLGGRYGDVAVGVGEVAADFALTDAQVAQAVNRLGGGV